MPRARSGCGPTGPRVFGDPRPLSERSRPDAPHTARGADDAASDRGDEATAALAQAVKKSKANHRGAPMSLIADDFDNEIASFENEETQEVEMPAFLCSSRLDEPPARRES